MEHLSSVSVETALLHAMWWRQYDAGTDERHKLLDASRYKASHGIVLVRACSEKSTASWFDLSGCFARYTAAMVVAGVRCHIVDELQSHSGVDQRGGTVRLHVPVAAMLDWKRAAPA